MAESALNECERDARDEEIERLKAKVGEFTRASKLLLLRSTDWRPPPFGREDLEDMTRSLSPSAQRLYPIVTVCRL